MSSRPNILFLLGEQHHPDVISAAGHPLIETAHLDFNAKTQRSKGAEGEIQITSP